MSPRRGRGVWPPARALVTDALLAALLGLLSAGFLTQAPLGVIPPQPHATPDALAVALMAVGCCALLVRSLSPVVTFTVTVAPTVVYLAASYVYAPPLFLTMLIAVYSLAARWPVRRSAAVTAVAMLALVAGHAVASGGLSLAQLPPWFIGSSGWVVIPWAIGVVVGFRRDAVAQEREQAARRYADEERLRIAREVHDVVGHGLAAINMQAGVALHVLDRRPEQARPALEAIKRSSKDALDELRGTLAVFRQPGGPEDADAPTGPTPGLGQLDTLVSSTSESGIPVDVEITDNRTGTTTGGPAGTASEDGARPASSLPAAVDVAAYRIVQESLTNVLRHAGQATARVRIAYEPGEVLVEVTDDGHAGTEDPGGDGRAGDPAGGAAGNHGRGQPGGPTGGHGIAGMRERATALGGTLAAGPLPEGGFAVRARLPTRE